ncbi:HlyD family efflux transporter periplasmic adaptor subunit [Novosphingobium sp. Gsoil 351]|uniref:HlyD family efflux transporter periplasmic adaptor subunit n=1 Tax=Novosphingobium sp. Gsoil 351 TaxID=2675225 RepID=UPI0012B46422|nr:HlyD family efflux transporter periplasmic adaptor subunit [Novosphingobium sp. Gsoil 351]QGN55733.1 HlyD family efflux transporter periplasmic adaptor subunit [Novosphingobium sp. Gsoil 351]
MPTETAELTQAFQDDKSTVTHLDFRPPDPPHKRTRRGTLFAGLGLALAAATAGYFLLADGDHVATDNAYVNAETAQVTPLVAGAVADVAVRNTEFVRQGQILFRLDDTDARLAVAKAEAEYQRVRRQFSQALATSGALGSQVAAGGAEIARARADLAIASAAFEKARTDLGRRSGLTETGAVSGEELTAARNAYAAAAGNVAQARAGLAQASAARNAAAGNRAANDAMIAGATVDTHPDVLAAKAKLDQAKVDLARTVIRAPLAGVVTNRQVQVGQRLAAGAAAMTIVPLGAAYVDANFKEGQLTRVRIGQPVKLTSDVYGSDVVYHGRVAGFSGGTGSAFALIPAQNATGNWIKVVQRLPVRVALDPRELVRNPLQVGLSMEAEIDVSGKG